MDKETSNPFSFWVPLDLEKSVASGSQRPVCGIISTEDADLEGERILEELSDYSPMLSAMGKNLAASAIDNLDFDRFSTRHGYLKYEHFVGECRACGAGETANIVGVPTGIEKSVSYLDPISKSVKMGTAIWGELFAPGLKKSADDAWDLMQAIRKSGFKRRLGYSIEGAYAPYNGGASDVRKCLVTNVVITSKPVNSFTFADMAKALVSGGGITDSAQLTGGGALRTQSIWPLTEDKKSKKKTKCDHEGDGGVSKSVHAALEHLVVCKGLPLNAAKLTVLKTFRRAA